MQALNAEAENNIYNLRGPLEVVVNITNKCNLRCLHCFNDSGIKGQDELMDAELLSLIDELCRIKPFNVCFSGGEPLIRRRLLLEAMHKLSSHGIRISLVTNGTLLDKETANDLVKAGVRDLEVSLDGARAETHEKMRRLPGSFDKAINALRLFGEAGVPSYGPCFTITKFNAYEIETVITLTEEIGAPSLMIRPLLFTGRANSAYNDIAPTLAQYRAVRSIVESYMRRPNKRLEIVFPDPMSHIFVFANGKPYYGIEIKADGSIIPSPNLQLKLGNIRDHTVTEYWNAGWAEIWQKPLIRSITSLVYCSKDLQKVEDAIQGLNTSHIDLISNNLLLSSEFTNIVIIA